MPTSLKSRSRSTRSNPKKANPPPLNIRDVKEGAVHTRAPLSTSFPNDAAYIPVPGTTFGGPKTTEGFGVPGTTEGFVPRGYIPAPGTTGFDGEGFVNFYQTDDVNVDEEYHYPRYVDHNGKLVSTPNLSPIKTKKAPGTTGFDGEGFVNFYQTDDVNVDEEYHYPRYVDHNGKLVSTPNLSPIKTKKVGGRKKNRTNRRKKNTRRIKKRKNTRKY